VQGAGVVVDEVERTGARLVGITGGVAAGKSTLAAAVAATLGAPVLATDGFLHPNAILAERDLTHRKGFPESFDAAALAAALDRWCAEGEVEVPVYSHLFYDVVPPPVRLAGERLVVEGLHLGHPGLGVRDRFDLLVHVDADEADLARWFLDRFRELRADAATVPGALLHPFKDLPADTVEGMAMDVWRAVNVAVLVEEVRPWEGAADLVVRLGPGHEVLEVVRRS
jgi:type I pantothenate kinase